MRTSRPGCRALVLTEEAVSAPDPLKRRAMQDLLLALQADRPRAIEALAGGVEGILQALPAWLVIVLATAAAWRRLSWRFALLPD